MIWSISGRDGCAMCRSPVGVFQVRAPGLRDGLSRHYGHWIRVRETCGLQPPASSGASPKSPKCKRRCITHRLVTLTGVGGVGKTRLATEVAARLADEFPDGVWFFELAAVTDPAAVPDAVAAVLGITQQPGKSVSESVATALEGRVSAAGVRQLRARPRRGSRSGRGDPRAVGDRENLGHQPRRFGGRRRASVAGALAGRRRGNRLCRSQSVRRTRPECGPALLDGQR